MVFEMVHRNVKVVEVLVSKEMIVDNIPLSACVME